MMNFKILVAGILLTIFAGSAMATLTGKQLQSYCTSKNNQNNKVPPGFCIGYVAGFLDTYVLTSALYGVEPNKRHFCLGRKGISYQDAVQTAVKYLQNNPDKLDQSARKLLVMAFASRYPCQGNSGQQKQIQPNNKQQPEYHYPDQSHDSRFNN